MEHDQPKWHKQHTEPLQVLESTVWAEGRSQFQAASKFQYQPCGLKTHPYPRWVLGSAEVAYKSLTHRDTHGPSHRCHGFPHGIPCDRRWWRWRAIVAWCWERRSTGASVSSSVFALCFPDMTWHHQEGHVDVREEWRVACHKTQEQTSHTTLTGQYNHWSYTNKTRTRKLWNTTVKYNTHTHTHVHVWDANTHSLW